MSKTPFYLGRLSPSIAGTILDSINNKSYLQLVADFLLISRGRQLAANISSEAGASATEVVRGEQSMSFFRKHEEACPAPEIEGPLVGAEGFPTSTFLLFITFILSRSYPKKH